MVIAAESMGVGAELAPWANLTATVVVAGLLIWLITKYIPKRDGDHRDDMKSQADKFEEHLASQRSDFLVELREHRADRAHENKTHTEALQAVSRAVQEGLVQVKEGLSQLADSHRSLERVLLDRINDNTK